MSGKLRWYYQGVPNDFKDYGMQSSPISASVNGIPVVIGAGKMGYVYEMNAETGKLIWKTAVGEHNGHDNDSLHALEHTSALEAPYTTLPGSLGGVLTNLALAANSLYVVTCDLPLTYTSLSEPAPTKAAGPATGDAEALNLATGKVEWDTKVPQLPLGAATASNDLVFRARLGETVRRVQDGRSADEPRLRRDPRRCRRGLQSYPAEQPQRSSARVGRPRRSMHRTRHAAGRLPMKAIVVTDQAAGTAGMTLVERPEPPAAINDVVVQVHASGFVPTEMAWPSTWTDRRDRDRTPSIPGHEMAGVVTALGYGTTGLSVGQRVFGLTDGIATAPWRSMWRSRHATSRRCRATSTSRWARACRSRA